MFRPVAISVLIFLSCSTVPVPAQRMDPIFAPPGALSSSAPAFLGPNDAPDAAPVGVFPPALVFAAARDREEATTSLELRNGMDTVLEVKAVELTGAGAEHFRLRDLPPLPVRVAPRSSLRLSVAFLPGASAPVAVYKAAVRFLTDRAGAAPQAGLSALAFVGADGSEAEPPLQSIVDTLGFAVDVGGRQQVLGNGTGAIGDELTAPLFERASAGPVLLIPLACFAVKGLSFGSYRPAASLAEVQPRVTGTFVVGQNKHLRPRLEPRSETALDIGDQPFGVWLQGANRQLRFFTEDRLNVDGTHRARVYPLRFERGRVVPHAFLVAFENWTNWDYQDALFVLWNADVAPARPATK